MSAPRVLLVAGEASGDLHAGEFLEALHELRPGLEVAGIGGAQSRRRGMETWIDTSEIAAMGLTEVFEKARVLRRAFVRMRDELRERPPALLVLIDFPEFNLALAKHAKRAGVPVLFYVSPQVWAWRRGRVRKILARVDRLAVILPFEPEVYHDDPKVTFVGHPLLDTVRAERSRDETLRRHGLEPGRRLVALLPGSRRKEIERHLPVMLEAAYRLAESRVLQFAIAVAPTLTADEVRSIVGRRDLAFPMVEGDTYELVHASDLVLTSSGTATLEVALLERPMVLMYRTSWTTWFAARAIVRGVDSIGMPNLIAGRRIVPELLQGEVNAATVERVAASILDDPEEDRRIRDDLARVREKLGEPGAARRVAALALELVGSPA